MTLTNEQILQLAREGDEFTTVLVMTIDTLADQVKNLTARVKQLEA